MVEVLTSPNSFLVALGLFASGAIGSLLFKKNDTFANRWSGFFALAGTLWGVIFSSAVIVVGEPLAFPAHGSFVPLLVLALHIDLLSAFFLLIISNDF